MTLPDLFALALLAFYMWIGVRIINRREQWAIQLAILVTLVVFVPAGLFALYVIWDLWGVNP